MQLVASEDGLMLNTGVMFGPQPWLPHISVVDLFATDRITSLFSFFSTEYQNTVQDFNQVFCQRNLRISAGQYLRVNGFFFK